MVLEATRKTNEKQLHKIGKPRRHGKGSFDREGTLGQIYQRVRELQNEALCERASTVLQLPEVRSPEQMDDVLETIHIALSGTTSLPRKISTGNTCLVHVLNKIIEVAMDAINTHTVYMIWFFQITALIRDINTLQAEEEKLFRKPAFLKVNQIIFRYA